MKHLGIFFVTMLISVSTYADTLKVIADDFFYDLKNQEMTYNGKVILKSDTVNIEADMVYLKNTAADDQLFEAKGDIAKVTYVNKLQDNTKVLVEGRHILLTITPEDQSLSVNGKGRVAYGESVIISDTIYYSMLDQVIRAKRDSKQIDSRRVEITVPVAK